MTSIQQILTMGGLVLLTFLLLNYNRSESHRIVATRNNEIIISGTEVGQSLLERILSKSFDENTVDGEVDSEQSLTISNNFGPEGGEILVTDFDDIDDFHGYQVTDSTNLTGNYETNVNISYFDYDNGYTTTSRTFTKLVEVYVANQDFTDTLKLYHIKGY